MKIKVYKDKKAEYVPDILFEDGTYKDAADYIKRMKAMDQRKYQLKQLRNVVEGGRMKARHTSICLP